MNFRSRHVWITFSVIALMAASLLVRHVVRKSKSISKDKEGVGLFTQTVSPLLEHSCIRCHGPDEHKGDLRLDTREGALLGGLTGPALIPGDPAKSLMLQLVRHLDPKREMPPSPKVKLASSKIDALEKWIKLGAPWPRNPEPAPPSRIGAARSDPRNPIAKMFGGKRLDLWSMQPISKAAPPKTRQTTWVRNPIDAFALAKMEAAGEKPAPEASRRTLARRLYFDLTGLPPSPDEMAVFLADDSPDAYHKLVETLLNSRQYGEHWANFWLDVVRYSDSNGFDYDEFRPFAWRFRDYVIRSFNADKPYDQFVKEQLAGDEMFDGPPQTAEDQDRLIATGYLRIGPYDNSAVLFGEADRCHSQVMADMVETTGAAFLGLNLTCCRCHDHKVDPISQADYYRLQAVFENVEGNDKLLLDFPSTLAVIEPEVAAIEQVREKLTDIENATVKRLHAEKIAKLSEADQQLLAHGEEGLSPELKEHLKQINRTIHTTPIEAKDSFNTTEKAAYEACKAEIKAMQDRRTPYTQAFLATDTSAWPPATHLFYKGDYMQPRETVVPGVLSVLDPNPLPVSRPARHRSSGRRTAFAAWLFSEDNPLTARVMVNRLWQNHFETGLHATPNDFGYSGGHPSDPAHLDWLAREFKNSGWSIKHMHRLMVESATYRQGFSKKEDTDPKITLGNPMPHRLTAEELRDTMLSVAGRLTPHDGGPPIWPELPPEVLNSPNLLVKDEDNTRGWYTSPHDQQYVRSIFLMQKRSLQIPMLELFDQPESNRSCGRRNHSTVSPQALTLLNSPFATEMAQSFADRLIHEAGQDPAQQIEQAFLLALQRPASDTERTRCIAFLQDHHLRDLCLALMNLNEFAYID